MKVTYSVKKADERRTTKCSAHIKSFKTAKLNTSCNHLGEFIWYLNNKWQTKSTHWNDKEVLFFHLPWQYSRFPCLLKATLAPGISCSVMKSRITSSKGCMDSDIDTLALGSSNEMIQLKQDIPGKRVQLNYSFI